MEDALMVVVDSKLNKSQLCGRQESGRQSLYGQTYSQEIEMLDWGDMDMSEGS